MLSSLASSANTQTSLIQMLQQEYASTDADSSGSLSLAEFSAGAPEDVSEAQQEQLFSTLDTDGNGSLSEDEFTTGLQENTPPPASSLLSGDTSQALAELFQNIDSDGDGFLSVEEFEAGAPEDTAEDQAELFSQIDENGDGSLSEEEFAAAIAGGPAGGGRAGGGAPPASSSSEEEEGTTTYDPLDTNEDGVVSLEELMAGQASEEDSSSLDPKATLDYLISLQTEEKIAA